jgi:hypothetical protein
MNTRTFLCTLGNLGAVSALGPLSTSASAAAADPSLPHLTAELIWGTNGTPPPEKPLRPISPELATRLRRIFKWRNYFEIERKSFPVTASSPAKVEMSRECRLEVRQISPQEFEVQLFGKGVLVVKKRQRLETAESMVLGGDDKNDDAWFVILRHSRPEDLKSAK